jgi:TolA-binding protein
MQGVFSYDIELHNSAMHSKLITSRQIYTLTLAIALCCGAILVPALEVKSQLTHELEVKERIWSKANDAFKKKQFALAMKNFGDFMEFEADVKSERFVEAAYLESICALNLYHKDAEFRIDEFITAYPESPYVLEALYSIADHHYKRRHYGKAAEAFNKVDLRQLSTDKKRELQFKRGHSFFEKENFEAARYDLFDVMKSKGTFHSAATYYFSHIAYLNDNPKVALDGFYNIADDPDFVSVVPIYIAQSLHASSQFTELQSYGPPLLDESAGLEDEERVEIARLVGDAFYKDQDFTSASPYLEMAWEGTRGPGRKPEFAYEVGYTRYRMGAWRDALDVLALTAREDNKLGQNATYHMADCYIQLGQKDKARSAFGRAASKEFDIEIMEDALFSYAKLAFELSYNPLDDAITAFQRYLDKYPNSIRRDEAYRFLIEVYLVSRDYDRALDALDKIRDKDATIQSSYQLLAYNRGVELYQRGRYTDAVPYFDKVRTYPIDAQLAAESFYWQGECYFASRDYTNATISYSKFSTAPGGYSSDFYPAADYARGYSLFKRKKYSDALSAFRSYLEAHPEDAPKRVLDAELRTADCFYAKKEFDRAVTYYDKCLVNKHAVNIDYILYQRAMSISLSDDTHALTTQIQVLDRLLEEYPNSRFVVDALYESARTLIELDELDDANTRLNELLSSHPRNPRTKEALVDLCLIGIKQDRPDDVLATWDKIRTTYGNDPVAADAYNIVEPLLIERGLLDDLPPAVGLSGEDIESRLYEAAVSLALEENYSKALPRLEEYLRQYENGNHIDEAHFYLAACLTNAGDKTGALLSYEMVIALPPGDFTEAAAIAAATLAWNEGDYPRALNHYRLLADISSIQSNKLESSIGQMRCYYLLDQPAQAFTFANSVYTDPGTPESIKRTASLWLGRIHYDSNELEQALGFFESTVKFGGDVGAESQFMISRILFNKAEYEKAEQNIFTLVSDYSSYDEWKFKGFLLLVRTYIGLDDLFQARATAESILENVDEEWVQNACTDLMLEIEILEEGEPNGTDLIETGTLIDNDEK